MQRDLQRSLQEAVVPLGEVAERAPEPRGVPSGVEGLDGLFFTARPTSKGPERVPLGGIPEYAVLNLTGISDTGKSLMVEQFALKRASEGHPVAFVTVETPAVFLVAALKGRAQAMGIDYDAVEDRIVIVDAASYHTLREEIPALLDTLAHVIKTYRVCATVVDSVTGLYEAREMMARQVVRALYNFLKKWHQTADGPSGLPEALGPRGALR